MRKEIGVKVGTVLKYSVSLRCDGKNLIGINFRRIEAWFFAGHASLCLTCYNL